MFLTQDLRLEADILPLFDYTSSDGAALVLRQLLLEPPASLAGVQERQAIVRGLLTRWEQLAGFSYSRIQYADAAQLLRDLHTGRLHLDRNPVVASLRLLVSEQARYQQRARLVQLIQLLDRLYQRVLLPLAGAELPAAFQAQLALMRRLHEQLGVAGLMRALQETDWSVRQLVTLGRQVQQLPADTVQAFWTAFHQFEAYWSVARAGQERGFTLPELGGERLELDAFFHPALAQPVKNTLHLTPAQPVVLLTGPNMSGKSTLLKAVGLCAYLAHVGFPVPAARCALPYFAGLAVAINRPDSLLDGYSHFMAELQSLKQVLLTAAPGRPVLAVFDELFRGTNADDALDLTRTTVMGLTRYAGSFFFVSTHLLQLPEQLPAHAAICPLSIGCTLHEGQPRFTYRLQPGWNPLRIGRLLFEQVGLNALLEQPAPTGTPA